VAAAPQIVVQRVSTTAAAEHPMLSTAFLSILNGLVDYAQDPAFEARSCVRHLSFGRLVDYVRGLGTAAARDQVREHLASCPQCEQSASRLTRLAEVAWSEMDACAPDEVVDEAIALFPADASDRLAVSDLGRLMSDPSRRRAFGGDVDLEPRHEQRRFLRIAPGSGEITLHLLVIEDVHGVSIAGEISARTAGRPLDGAVSVHRGPGQPPIAETRASDGGLFQLRYRAPAGAWLHLVVGGELPIDAFIDNDAVDEGAE
jgi:hypothetical protein